ncbi:MAG: glycosyltransferase family 39 protein [Planctomycetaceae bacterium]
MKSVFAVPPLVIAVLAAGLIYFYPLTLGTPLLEPDEGLHATISQEMLEHGEWIVPRFRGEPFHDKPILYFWAQMLSLAVFGMNEAAVRLPGLLFGLLGSVTCGLLAKQLFGKSTGWFATVASMSMIIPLALAQAAAHDVALVPMTNLALLSLWKMEQATDRRSVIRWTAAAAVMIGLAILTKALIGVAVICVGFCAFLLFSRRLSISSLVRLAFAGFGGAVVASPWYIAMEIRNSGYLYYYFIERHLMGFTTSTQRHGNQPWFYYLPWIILGASPWILHTLPLLKDRWARRTEPAVNENNGTGAPSLQIHRQALLLVLCWLFGGVLFLSVAKSKLITYALPLYPAVAILAAVAWQKRSDAELSPDANLWFHRIQSYGGLFAFAVPPTALLVCGLMTGTGFPVSGWICAAAVSMICVATWKSWQAEQYRQASAFVSLWVGGLTAVLMTWPLPYFSEDHSERPLAGWLNEHNQLPGRLSVIGERPASVIFYLTPKLRERLNSEQLTSIDVPSLEIESADDQVTHFAVREAVLQEASAAGIRVPGTECGRAGQFVLFEVSSESAVTAETKPNIHL